MTKRGFLLVAVAALIVLPTSQLEAKEGSPWVHIRVTEHDGSNQKVSVNLPLSVVQVALDVAPEKIISDGHIHIDHCDHDLSVADLRRMWQELKESGEAEFVTVEGDDDNVRIFRTGDLIQIDVQERSHRGESDDETVHIKVPVKVVDALLSGEGEELNLRDALEELKDERGEIVIVEGGDADIRIWIDDKRS